MTTRARDRLVPAVVRHLGDNATIETVFAFLISKRLREDAAIQLIDEAILSGTVTWDDSEE